MNRLPLVVFAVAVGGLADWARADEPAAVSFRRDVAPILVRQCLPCHNPKKTDSGLDLSTLARLRQGGKAMPSEAIVPGDAEASHLLAVVQPDAEPRMPYKLPPLPAADIATLTRWIEAGAPFDGGDEAQTRIASLVDPYQGLPDVSPARPTTDPVLAAAFRPDGNSLAAARGGEVALLDPHQPASSRILSTNEAIGEITALVFRPDGNTLIAAGGRPGIAGAIRIWKTDAPDSAQSPATPHTDAILAAALAADGRTLATAGYDRAIQVWNLDALDQPPRALLEHTDAVYDVAFSPDGTRLASAGGDRTVKLWDVATGKRLLTLGDATGEVYAVRFTPDGQGLLAAGVDRILRHYRVEGDRLTLAKQAQGHEAAIVRIETIPGTPLVATTGEDRVIQLWNAADLAPVRRLEPQPDWAQTLAGSPDGKRLAVGRHDGSLVLYDLATGQATPTPWQPAPAVAAASAPADPAVQPAAAQEPPKPTLALPPTLNPPAPRGLVRGQKREITLSGRGIDRADLVVFPEAGITPRIVPAEKPTPDQLRVELDIAPTARPGIHVFGVRTPTGTPAFQTLVIDAYPETALAEPTDPAAPAPEVALPATVLGTIDAPGDRDTFAVTARAGEALVLALRSQSLGSSLRARIELAGPDGQTVAAAETSSLQPEPTLVAPLSAAGKYTVTVTDLDYGGGGNHFFRITAGVLPYLARVWPLGAAIGGKTEFRLEGVNLGPDATRFLEPAATVDPGTLQALTGAGADGAPTLNSLLAVAHAGPQVPAPDQADPAAVEAELPAPAGTSGAIDRPGDQDLYAFPARKGERLVIEVHARRLGSPLDPRIEILDTQNQPVPRVLLRPVSETTVAFRDHNAAGRTIRLTAWNDLAMGDYLLAGRELMRISELPRNPDDDALFDGVGLPRHALGERAGALGTTAEHHPLGQTLRKVEILPPGTPVPPGGLPPVTLHYQNDDGGPGLGKDALLVFDPPADGTYRVRVADARGQGGSSFAYHLMLRAPRPDFRLRAVTENPAIARGGSTGMTVLVDRLDGFEGPIDLSLTDLPPGVTATATRIEPRQNGAEVVLSASADAPAQSPPTWKLAGRALLQPGQPEVVRKLDPGGPAAGWITTTEAANLRVHPRSDRVLIEPGKEVTFVIAVERSPAFTGRVPLEVRNLPYGVRVMNVGLNGILVTETQTERTVTLYAEPWVEPMTREIFALGKCEAAGTDDATSPFVLEVRKP